MTDITDLWIMIPSRLVILHNIVIQFVKIEELAKLVEEYLTSKLNVTYNSTTWEIELSTPLTFTLHSWKVGLNCESYPIKCVCSHSASLLCVRFFSTKESNIEAYQIGMNLLIDIIATGIPFLEVYRYKNTIVSLKEQPFFDRIATISGLTITCTRLHITGTILRPHWKLQSV